MTLPLCLCIKQAAMTTQSLCTSSVGLHTRAELAILSVILHTCR